MKITDLKSMAIKIPQEDTFGGKGVVENEARTYDSQPGWRGLYSRQTETTLVKAETDEGIVGWGEGQSPVGPEVTAAVIDKILRPIFIGHDPSAVGVLRHKMYQTMNVRGHYSGFMVHGIAAVDLALWDIRGKKLGVPVAELLGGAFRDRIPAYVSGIQGDTVDAMAKTAVAHVAEGFDALKMFLGFGLKQDLAQVEAIRNAVGPDVRLMVDTLWNYDVPVALQLGRRLDETGVFWFEAPTSPEDIAGHAELARELDLFVAAGETETTCYQFLDWFQARGLDVAQPDAGRCGITEAMKIADMAETFNVPIALHAGICLQPSIAASIHVGSAIPNLLYQEYQPVMLDLANSFLKESLVCKAGYFSLPEGSGLGIEMDETKLEKYVVAS